ncbi:MAG: hypothetical protein H0U28_14400 [Nocardioidaceae bacterium]|nr:hypothetical protein [Nocardioidaceae bacterium]
MAGALALLPSPLLGPAVWGPVAAELRRTGWSVVECSAAVAAPQTWQDVLRRFIADLPAERDLVLIPHSNAGLYVPALTRERHVVASLFVDAGLPLAEGSTPLAPAAFYDFLATRADEGAVLPPWTQWWEDADIDGLVPSRAAREGVEKEQHRLPLAYFRDSLPVPGGWDEKPCGYLAFGDTYADERQQAEDRGWPVRTLAGRHLHTLVKPREVAAAIAEMLPPLGVEPPHR